MLISMPTGTSTILGAFQAIIFSPERLHCALEWQQRRSRCNSSMSCECAATTGNLMPLYFFNARINGELILDPEGQELRDADAAWETARSAILELLHGQVQAALLNSTMEVTDAHGDIVLEFPFSEALTPEGRA